MNDQVRDWWRDNPMTYGAEHGRTEYRDGVFELGTREFLERVDQEFYSWNRPLHDRRPFDRLFPYDAYGPGSRVLEIGCGLGTMAMNWARNGVDMTAVDLNPTSISQTRRRFELRGPFGSGVAVYATLIDTRGAPRLYASSCNAYFGMKLLRSTDLGKKFHPTKSAPQFPEGDGRALANIWALEPGSEPGDGRLWLGTIPGGLFFSEAVMLSLVRTGLARQAAYELVQKHALAVATSGAAGASFRERLGKDADIAARPGIAEPVEHDAVDGVARPHVEIGRANLVRFDQPQIQLDVGGDARVAGQNRERFTVRGARHPHGAEPFSQSHGLGPTREFLLDATIGLGVRRQHL